MIVSVEEVYEAEDCDTRQIPLILIHDGGGTIFQYYMLGYLGRKTLAIPNPHFQDGTRPERGIPELARAYAKAIEGEVGTSSVILGGWSLGGMISIEIARVLQESCSKIRIAGLLLIDSYCPWAVADSKSGKIEPTFRDTTSERMKELTRASFAHAGTLISSWKKPSGLRSPPAILIRAEQSRFKKEDDDGKLGWSAYDELNIKHVVTVPGDHFSMFSEENLDNITEKLKHASTQF